MGRVVAIANQKGGVGKTTTAINLAAALAESGQNVLAVDFDPQGNMSSGLGIDKQNLDLTVYHSLIEEEDVNHIIKHTATENLDLLPSNVNLAGAEIELLDMDDRENVLKRTLEPIREKYDFIIIDCPPSLSLLTLNALTASDTVLVPIQCEYYALEGLSQMMKTINLVKQKLNTKLSMEGVVFTMYDARNRLSQQVVDSVKEVLNERIYNTIIPRNVRLAEAPSFGMPVTEYDSKSSGAESYRLLAAEVLSRED